MVNLIYLMDCILFLTFLTFYFEYIIKKHETMTDNPPIQICVNKIKNRIVFKIKTDYKLELLSKETMNLLGSTKQVIDKDKSSENIPNLGLVEVVLMHCNLVKNDYQQASKVIFTFVPNKQFGQLINISPHSLIMLNTINTEIPFMMFGSLIKIINLLKLKIMLTWLLLLGKYKM